MSGHSKWSTIKRKKGAADAKRGVIFTRLSKDITLAAKHGGGDADMNPSLRLAVKKAKASNMPSANIERAIKKGTGELPGIRYEDHEYEGYGPESVAILIEVMTDNKNRTASNIRHLMTKYDGNLGESGCVGFQFEKKGIIRIDNENINEDEIFNIALDSGADDIDTDLGDFIEISTTPEQFGNVTKTLEESGFNVEGEVSLVANNSIKLSGSELSKCLKLIDLLEDHDDVQKVYSNIDFDITEISDS
jgi:YebC/PmpR family DNA-binding regulatory protein